MSELKASSRLRMIAKGAYSRGDVIAADRLARIAIDLDNKDEEIAALKTYASKGDEEIKKLSPLVEIVSNQKQRIQQLEEDLKQVSYTSKRYIDRNEKRKDNAKAEIAELYFWLNHAHAWLDIDVDYKDSPICEKITETLAKHKGE